MADFPKQTGVNHLLLDGDYFYWCSWSGVWGAGATYGLWRNIGTSVRGGRHTLRAEYDWAEEIVESSEGDNIYQAQFVWSPYALANETPEGKPYSLLNLPYCFAGKLRAYIRWMIESA